jgi:Ca-activated chloride channel family protein
MFITKTKAVMENQDKIYEQFKDAANRAEDKDFARMEAVWNRVEEKLDTKKQRRIAAWWKYTGIAALFLLFMGIGTFMLKNENNPVTVPKVIPENNVTVIDTQKVNEALNPSATTLQEEVVTNEKGKTAPSWENDADAGTNADGKYDRRSKAEEEVVLRTTSKKALVWNHGEVAASPAGGDIASPLEPEDIAHDHNYYRGDVYYKSNATTAVLDEVVVEGYRTTTKSKSNVTSTTTVTTSDGRSYRDGDNNTMAQGYISDSKSYTSNEIVEKSVIQIQGRPNASFTQTLQGQVPGLNITSGSGQPGANSNVIVLRGAGSINGNNDPLYVIDGVITGSNAVRNINPSEIASIDVLKDAAAITIYGNRGANGVIIVKTKNAITKKEKRKLDRLNKKLEKQKKEHPELFTQPVAPKVEVDSSQEDYESFAENQFENPAIAPLSTFSIDVDNASYTNVRRFINNGQVVPKDAVRVEEMINFFKYQYPQPTGNNPFSINTEYSDAPWNPKHKLLKIGLQGKIIADESLPSSNFVFLIDISGSMSNMNKLPLLKQSMKLLVNQMRRQDRIAIVVYAGAAGLVLPSTSGDEKDKIFAALDKLEAGGSTAGGEGIELAYKTAVENFVKKGNNRVILATDGDFNVGASSDSDMQTLIEEKRKSGVFLTCLGYGMDNYKDSKMEILADKGNGNYAYIDNMQEATRFLDKEFKGSMYAIAKDVKIQIEFNPKHVQSYRLIGYENRKLRDEDFVNDAIDAGELGSGHIVTALYEIIPVGVESEFFTAAPDLKYSQPQGNVSDYNDELATIKFRHKKPDEDKSTEIVQVIPNIALPLQQTSGDYKFSAAVAWFGLKLRDSKLIPNKTSGDIIALAKQGLQNDPEGYRAEFVRLVEMVK